MRSRKLWAVAAALVAVGMATWVSADRYLDETWGKFLAGWEQAKAANADVRAMSDFTLIRVLNSKGAQVGTIYADPVGDGAMGIADNNGNPRAGMVVGVDGQGVIGVYNSGGRVTYLMDGHAGFASASGDVAETFPAAPGIREGSVVVIDAEKAGYLKLASEPYDRRVAGVVSGAQGYPPGMTLRGIEPQEGRRTVTLTGTVYCLATSSNGPIRAGDLLTTSSVPGHAMRATDREAAHGAVLGKAMEALQGDTGLILVLANLQ